MQSSFPPYRICSNHLINHLWNLLLIDRSLLPVGVNKNVEGSWPLTPIGCALAQWCSGKKRSGHTVYESPLQAKKNFWSSFKCSYSRTRVLEIWNTKIIPPPPPPGPLLFLIKFGKPSQLHCSGIISRHIRFSIILLCYRKLVPTA